MLIGHLQELSWGKRVGSHYGSQARLATADVDRRHFDRKKGRWLGRLLESTAPGVELLRTEVVPASNLG